jgi:PAT family acetyl-CoA transporter-like MFS transporter 1
MRASMSYTQIGVFTLAAYPYSFKLLWAPVVDSFYFRALGRRRSWIVPLQLAAGVLMLRAGGWAEARLSAGDAGAVTALFFALVLLAATQDIAVDGWALTLLSKKNVGYAATCQTVGMNLGYFASFTVFLALNDGALCARLLPDRAAAAAGAGAAAAPPLVTLAGYMRFWGWAYLVITAALLAVGERGASAFGGPGGFGGAGRASRVARPPLLSADGRDDGDDGAAPGVPLREAYAQLWRVACLPHVRLLAGVLVAARLGALPAESAAALKLLEKGASKEALAGLVLLEFPIELASALVAGRWAAAAHPLRPWLAGYRLRLAVAAATTAVVAAFPAGAAAPAAAPFAWAALAAVGVATSFASTLMFTALGDFYNRISDPGMGGAYLTLLNTLANVGVVVPKLFVFWAMDALTARRCVGVDAASGLADAALAAPEGAGACGPASAGGAADGACTGAGGACAVARDGFYVLSCAAVAAGCVLLAWLRRALPRLEAAPASAWRARKSRP